MWNDRSYKQRATSVCSLYVKAFQRHGIGRMLYLAAVAFAAREVHTFKITVNAAPQAVETYEHLGMHKVTEEQEKDGIRFVPMEAELVQSAYGQYSYHYGTGNPGQNAYGYGAGSSSSGSYSYGPGPEENGQGPAGTYSHQVQMPQRRSAVPVIVGVVAAIILLIVAVGGAFLFGSFIYYKAKDDVGITEDQRMRMTVTAGMIRMIYTIMMRIMETVVQTARTRQTKAVCQALIR